MPTESSPVVGKPRLDVGRLGLAVLVVVIPALMAFLLPPLFFGASLLDFVPYYSDEIEYWHETLTFIETGFSGGYYTIDEQPASAGFSHFGSHGPAYPVFFGMIGKIAGWRLNSAPLFNIVLFAGALVVFLGSMRLDARRLALTGALVVTFWPLVFLTPSNMQLAVHCSVAVLLAALFNALLETGENAPPAVRWGLLAFVFCVSMLRPTWSLLCLPLFLLSAKRSARSSVLAVGLAGAGIVAATLAFSALSAPHFDFAATRFFNPESFPSVIDRITRNLRNLVSFRQGHALETLQHYQVLLVAGVAVATFVRGRRATGRPEYRPGTQLPWEKDAIFHFMNFGPLLAMSIVIYDIWDWRDYRVFAPHLLLSALVLIARRSKLWLVGLIVVSNVLATPAFVDAYRQFTAEYFKLDRDALESFRAAAGSLRFDAAADPWCNTVLSSTGGYPLLAVPAGFGISYVFTPPEPPLKSQYLLFDREWLERNREYARRLDVEFVAATPIGYLYRNRAAECGSGEDPGG